MFSVCPMCEEWSSLQRHHKFSQSKLNKKYYTKKEIDDPRNILWICWKCHMNKPILKWNEKEFCEALNIKPRSKSGAL